MHHMLVNTMSCNMAMCCNTAVVWHCFGFHFGQPIDKNGLKCANWYWCTENTYCSVVHSELLILTSCIKLNCTLCWQSRIWLYAVTYFVSSISSVGGSAQECKESITLLLVPLDVLCDVVGIFEHVKELQCVITNPLEVCQLYTSLCALSLLHSCHTYT